MTDRDVFWSGRPDPGGPSGVPNPAGDSGTGSNRSPPGARGHPTYPFFPSPKEARARPRARSEGHTKESRSSRCQKGARVAAGMWVRRKRRSANGGPFRTSRDFFVLVAQLFGATRRPATAKATWAVRHTTNPLPPGCGHVAARDASGRRDAPAAGTESHRFLPHKGRSAPLS